MDNPKSPKGYWNRGKPVISQHQSDGAYIFRTKDIFGSVIVPPIPPIPPVILGNYWVAEYGRLIFNFNAETVTGSVNKDTQKNIYLTGATSAQLGWGGYSGVIAKYDFSGNLVSQYSVVQEIGGEGEISALSIDSSNNIALAFTSYSGTQANAYFSKIDQSGSILWQISAVNANYNYLPVWDMSSDGSSIYPVAGANGNYGPSAWISKIGGEGFWYWQKNISIEPGYGTMGLLGDVYSNNSLFFSSSVNSIANGSIIFNYLSKIDPSNGNVLIEKVILSTDVLNTDPYSYSTNTLVVDNQDNMYLIGQVNLDIDPAASVIPPNIIKVNSDFNSIDYQKFIYDDSIDGAFKPGLQITGAIVDSNNLYITGPVYNRGSLYIAKLDSVGDFIWQNEIVPSQSYLDQWWTYGHRDIEIVDSNTIVVTSFSQQNTQSTFPPVIYPNDGSLVFAAPNFLELTPGITIGSGAFTVEFWINFSFLRDVNLIFSGTGDTNALQLYINNSDGYSDPFVYAYGVYVGNSIGNNGHNTNWELGTGTNFTHYFNSTQWYHVAIVRDSSGNIAVFLDGTSLGYTTDNNNYSDPSYVIGGSNYGVDGASDYFDGMISDFSVVVGTNVYNPLDGSIAIPRQPLSVITNSQLNIQTTDNTSSYIDASNNRTFAANVPSFSFDTPIVPFTTDGPLPWQSANSTNTAYDSAVITTFKIPSNGDLIDLGANNFMMYSSNLFMVNSTMVLQDIPSVVDYTNMLLHFDESEGSTTTVDATGNYIISTKNPTTGFFIDSSNTISPTLFGNSGRFTKFPYHNGGMLYTPANTSLNVANTDWTIETFFNIYEGPNNNDTTDYTIWSYGDMSSAGAGNTGIRLSYSNTDPSVISVYQSGELLSLSTITLDGAIDPVSFNVWHHTALTHDAGNTTLHLYLDGSLMSSCTYVSGGTTGIPSGNVYIGGDDLSSFQGTYFDGNIDEFVFTYGSRRYLDPSYVAPINEQSFINNIIPLINSANLNTGITFEVTGNGVSSSYLAVYPANLESYLYVSSNTA